jgi:integrase
VITDYWNGQAQHLRSADTCKIMLRYWNDWWGEASVADVRNPSRQDDFRAHLAAKGLNPTSVTRCLEVGRAAIRRAWKRGAISSFPHIDVPLIGETEPKGRPLTVEEVGKLIAGTTEPHLQLFVLLLAATAARPEALFQLTWAQIDDEAGLIRLNPEGRRQTSKRRPVVQLLPSLVPVLAGVKRSDKHPNVILFRSKPIRKVDTGWHKMVERSKLKGRVTPYSLRHTAARWMRMKGVPMEQVAGQLGHAMPRFAMSERYAPHAPDYLKEAAAALDELLTLVLPAASQLRISESGKSSSISALAV